jgi:chromosome segregation ATPase
MKPSMPTRRLLALLAGATLLGLTGCATYLDAKRDTAPGGQQQRDIAAAKAEVTSAQAQNVALGDQKLQREREIERNDKRIRALEQDLRVQDQALAAALKNKKITQARYADLKRQADTLRQDTQSADLENKGASLAAPDARADAAKEARLKDLERRKKDLEAALAAIGKG